MGQASLTGYRSEKIRYLPFMYTYKFIVQSNRPREVSSYGTIIYPFDNFIWSFLFSSSVAVFLSLMLIQKIWLIATRRPPPQRWMYQGIDHYVLFLDVLLKTYKYFRYYPCSHSCHGRRHRQEILLQTVLIHEI